MSADTIKKSGGHEWPSDPLQAGETWVRVTGSPEETMEFGNELAKQFSPPCLILLEGELGAGKTTLIKGIVQGLGAAREEDVTSPSFALVHEYGGGGHVYHIDLYRIEAPKELATLGLDDILARDAVVLVEWGEKIGNAFGEPALRIRLEYAGHDDRKISITSSKNSA
jgi:tRNA threonylcarbamoyladenosine biosynthesis protein TsaE